MARRLSSYRDNFNSTLICPHYVFPLLIFHSFFLSSSAFLIPYFLISCFPSSTLFCQRVYSSLLLFHSLFPFILSSSSLRSFKTSFYFPLIRRIMNCLLGWKLELGWVNTTQIHEWKLLKRNRQVINGTGGYSLMSIWIEYEAPKRICLVMSLWSPSYTEGNF
jgi:hypothetical protein